MNAVIWSLWLSSGGTLADGSPICVSSSWADQTAWGQKSVSEVSNIVVLPHRRPAGLLPALATAAGTPTLPVTVCTRGTGLEPWADWAGGVFVHWDDDTGRTWTFCLRLISPVMWQSTVLHFICGCIGVFVLKLFLKSTTKSPSLQTPGACVRTGDVLLRSRVPFYGNSSTGSSSNVQEQQHQGTMRFVIKSLFLTNILRLYMFTLYWCWSLKAEVRYLLSLCQQCSCQK